MQIFDLVFRIISLPTLEIALVALLASGFINLGWSMTSLVSRKFREWASRSIEYREIVLGTVANVPPTLDGCYCQIIRYGTDQYLERLASDQERFVGQLQNRTLRVEARRNDASQYTLRLKIPVHKRLGTQFKLFVVPKLGAEAQPIIDFLSTLPEVAQPHATQYQKPAKIYFLLKNFATVKSVDGIENNMFFPL